MDIIRHRIKPEKGKAWHAKSHPYFTKQAHNVVREYILHYSEKGDKIFDPFGGTGVTAIEGLALGRKVVIMDINPLSCFLIKQNCIQINVDRLASTFSSLADQVKSTIQEYEQISDKDIEKIPIEYWFPQKVPLPKNADFNYVEDLFTHRQLLSYSLLLNAINQICDKESRDMLKYVFSSTLAKVNLTYMPSEREGKTVGGGGPSIFGKYRYWRPKVPRELLVWPNFEARFRMILKGKKTWNNITKDIRVDNNLTIIQGSALELSKHIAQNSIDYIYTDPPYGGNIAYLDLSTMWNAWLGFKVTEKMKRAEIIEGGDLNKTQDEYTSLFAKSFEEMGRVLKKGKWLSCVFAHKKLEYWNTIIDSCEENGLQFKGSVYQPTNNTSIHWKTNPANVLCSQRIANFQKTFQKTKLKKPDDLRRFIYNEIERACRENQGASLDDIYQRVLDQLLHTNSLGEAKRRGYLKLDNVLQDESLFYFDANSGLYYVKENVKSQDSSEIDYYRKVDELKVCLKELFLKNKSMTLDKIHKELFEIFADDKKFPIISKDLEELLPLIARKNPKSGNWQLIKDLGEQEEFALGKVLTDKLVRIKSDGHSHSEIIFRLVLIGAYLGFSSWIGKREQSIGSYAGRKFKDISLSDLPIKVMTPIQKANIEQIDVIWFDRLNFPRYAFEVEESTTMLSALERFASALEIQHDIAKKLVIVAPKSRKRKLEKTLRDSTYIGHPQYMENKVKFILKENLAKFYDDHIDKDFKEIDFKSIFDIAETD
jgi:DNA modification methylase